MRGMRSVLRFLWPRGVHRAHADDGSRSPATDAQPEGRAGKVWPSGDDTDDGGSTRCPSLEVPDRDEDMRDRCLAEAMRGRGDACATIEAWGAELGLARGDVAVENIIATGSTAEVFSGVWRGRQVAVKRLAASERRTNIFVRELGVMSRTQHPNLVRLLGFCHGEGALDLVLELCRGGSLFHLLHMSDVEVTLRQQFKVAGDVAEGMSYLHGLATPVLHRDLKSLNVVLHEPVRSPSDLPLAKITDFGLAKMRLGPPQQGVPQASCGELSGSCVAEVASRPSPPDDPLGPGASDEVMTGLAGTRQWMAPELLAGRTDYYLEVDVYAYGMLLFEIFCFEPPFADVEAAEVPRLVLEGVRPEIDEGAMPAPLEKLTRACWSQEPGERPSFFFLACELEEIWHSGPPALGHL